MFKDRSAHDQRQEVQPHYSILHRHRPTVLQRRCQRGRSRCSRSLQRGRGLLWLRLLRLLHGLLRAAAARTSRVHMCCQLGSRQLGWRRRLHLLVPTHF